MAALQTIALVAYPFAIYIALGFAPPRAIAGITLVAVAARFALAARARLLAVARVFAPVALVYGATSLGSLATGDPLWLLLAPALFNAAMLGVFASSLARDESAVETLARAQIPDLPADESSYCRRVTIVWCAFFALNGAVAAWLALRGTREAWALYTGGISYALLGALFGGEYLYRHWRFRRYRGGPADFLLRRVFPPASH